MGALDGKAAVVTGGSRGIGRAVVQRLAADGAAVVFGYATNQDYALIDRPATRVEQAGAFWTTVSGSHLSARRGGYGEFAGTLPGWARQSR